MKRAVKKVQDFDLNVRLVSYDQPSMALRNLEDELARAPT